MCYVHLFIGNYSLIAGQMSFVLVSSLRRRDLSSRLCGTSLDLDVPGKIPPLFDGRYVGATYGVTYKAPPCDYAATT